MDTDKKACPDACYLPSDSVVAREIDGDILIVPIRAGIGDAEEELYGLNPTAREVWNRLNGRTPVKAIIDELIHEYEAPPRDITDDVLGLLTELLKRGIVEEASPEGTAGA